MISEISSFGYACMLGKIFLPGPSRRLPGPDPGSWSSHATAACEVIFFINVVLIVFKLLVSVICYSALVLRIPNTMLRSKKIHWSLVMPENPCNTNSSNNVEVVNNRCFQFSLLPFTFDTKGMECFAQFSKR